MKWTPSEIERLAPILARIGDGLRPVEEKSILVLCSAGGEVALWLAQRMAGGRILGLELSPESLADAQRALAAAGLEGRVEFRPAEKTRIPFPDASFDGLVSEFILFPTSLPTEIGQPEMARVLKPGAPMLITDVIAPRPLAEGARQALQAIGLDYLCAATPADFCSWMESAGLVDVAVEDLTPLVRPVWEQRRQANPDPADAGCLRDPADAGCLRDPAHREGYALLLEEPGVRLGEGIFYIYVRGRKPLTETAAHAA